MSGGTSTSIPKAGTDCLTHEDTFVRCQAGLHATVAINMRWQMRLRMSHVSRGIHGVRSVGGFLQYQIIKGRDVERMDLSTFAARAACLENETLGASVEQTASRRLLSAGRGRVPARVQARCLLRRPPNVLGVSCTASSAYRSWSGAAVAAEELRSHDWRTATAVTP